VKSRRYARESALQLLYSCDTLGDWSEQTVALVLSHFFGLNITPEEFRSCSMQVAASSDCAKGAETSSETTSSSVERSSLSNPNTVFAIALVKGVIDHREVLDSSIQDAATHWSLARMAMIDRNILRVAAFEISFCDQIPASVSINEAIEIAKRFSGPESPNFINGVLDKIARLERVSQDVSGMK
jgi:transcription antitermination protein NusB